MVRSPFRPYRLTARFLTLPVLNDLSKLTPFARELTNVAARYLMKRFPDCQQCGSHHNVAVIRRRYEQTPLIWAHKLGHELGDQFSPFLQAQFGDEGGRALHTVLLQFASLPFRYHLTLNFDDSVNTPGKAGGLIM
jgi:hypothetical protein